MVYLDNAATTPVLPSFIEIVTEVMKKLWGNPSSPHAWGQAAASQLQTARTLAAQAINASSNQIIFTSGGSESNALALNGWDNIYVSAAEHHSIIMTPGAKLLPVNGDGIIMEGKLDQIEPGSLVSIQMVNSETGVWQDIKTLSKLTHDKGAFFHCDAVQAFPHFRIDVKDLDVDFLSISGHKFGCASGVGLLYVKNPYLVSPMIHNTQEFGMRGGTENLPYIVAMAKEMARVAEQNHLDHQLIYTSYESYLYDYFRQHELDFRFNGTRINYAILSVSFRGIDALQLVEALSEQAIYVSTGQACASHEAKPSYILEAMHVPEDYINGTIRLSFSPETTWEDIKQAAAAIVACVKLLGGKDE